jgi:hypothetical protein
MQISFVTARARRKIYGVCTLSCHMISECDVSSTLETCDKSSTSVIDNSGVLIVRNL